MPHKYAIDIWVVEDDFIKRGDVLKTILSVVPNAKITELCSESEFVKALESSTELPKIVVLDMMLKWQSIGDSFDLSKVPDDVRRDGFSRAGFRCLKRLANIRTEKRATVILHTVLDWRDLEAEGLGGGNDNRKNIIGPKGQHYVYLSKLESPKALEDEILRAL